MSIEQEQSKLKALFAKGKAQGYLTYAEVNDHLPTDIVDPEQIEEIISMINDMGITVYETAPPDDEDKLLDDSEVSEDESEDEAIELVSAESEFGRTTDPVRMYMREMGTVDLLTREGEIEIAKNIEEGIKHTMLALAQYPDIVKSILEDYAKVATGEKRLTDIITGFFDEDDSDSIPPEPQKLPAEIDVEMEMEVVIEKPKEKEKEKEKVKAKPAKKNPKAEEAIEEKPQAKATTEKKSKTSKVVVNKTKKPKMSEKAKAKPAIEIRKSKKVAAKPVSKPKKPAKKISESNKMKKPAAPKKKTSKKSVEK